MFQAAGNPFIEQFMRPNIDVFHLLQSVRLRIAVMFDQYPATVYNSGPCSEQRLRTLPARMDRTSEVQFGGTGRSPAIRKTFNRKFLHHSVSLNFQWVTLLVR